MTAIEPRASRAEQIKNDAFPPTRRFGPAAPDIGFAPDSGGSDAYGSRNEVDPLQPFDLPTATAADANIARARELMAAPMPLAEPPPTHDTAHHNVTPDHRPLCPCCGGRMIIIEAFARGAAPRGPPASADIRT